MLIAAGGGRSTGGPAPSPPIALDAGYRVQDQLREGFVAGGERVVGWKTGPTSRPPRSLAGIHHPCRLPPGRGRSCTGDTVLPVASRFFVVEAEIAFVMKRTRRARA